MDAPPDSPPRRGTLILRMDYGYPAPSMAGCREVDLAWAPLAEAFARAQGGRALVLHGSEMLLAWAKTRGGADLVDTLRSSASKRGLVLTCRFPRAARELVRLMGAHSEVPLFWETAADGRVPPLYETWASSPRLLRLHLEREWLTGVAAARGGVALMRVAWRLAEDSPLTSAAVASGLGVTAGAARSYLRWMEDAALVRRGAGGFCLRHPLLNTLFGEPASARAPEPEAPRSATSPGWDPIEID